MTNPENQFLVFLRVAVLHSRFYCSFVCLQTDLVPDQVRQNASLRPDLDPNYLNTLDLVPCIHERVFSILNKEMFLKKSADDKKCI